MFGNNMMSDIQWGGEKRLNIGFDMKDKLEGKKIEEVMIIEPGRSVGGDDGSSY